MSASIGAMAGRDVLDKYRRASVAAFVDVFANDAYGMLQAKYGDVVGPYFSARQAGAA